MDINATAPQQPEPAPIPETESFRCPNCGGTMKWSIPRQVFECVSCRTPGEVQTASDAVFEHPFEGYFQRVESEIAFPEQSFVVCQNCGAEVVFGETQTAAVCPMCSSSQVNLQKQVAGVPPDGIIPFKVDKPQAQENFKKWVKTRWFAPNKLKEAYQQGKLDGVYLPFWTFDADAEASYTGQGGKYVTRTDSEGKTYTETVWTPVSGHISASYDDIQVCAAQERAQQVIDSVLPYNTSVGSNPYAGAYLSGFEAERYAFGADQGVELAKQTMERDLHNKAEWDIQGMGYDTANVFTLNAQYHNIRYKHMLLPAWLSAFAFGGKQYLYVINGETGKVGGQRPYSIPKIIAACLVALAVVLFFILFFNDAEAAVPPPEAAMAQAADTVQQENVDRLDALLGEDGAEQGP
ncbi:transposase [Ruminococcaceae bacterium OttesenSCG-928-I18]|nr:transposase [Ruminococcaceae bacterium OttesenSCG-928-I18]